MLLRVPHGWTADGSLLAADLFPCFLDQWERIDADLVGEDEEFHHVQAAFKPFDLGHERLRPAELVCERLLGQPAGAPRIGEALDQLLVSLIVDGLGQNASVAWEREEA